MRKARYVPVKRGRVPPVVFEHLEDALLKSWNPSVQVKPFRCVVQDKQESGIAYEFMTMDAKQRLKSRQRWYVADANIVGSAR